ncbi:endo-1,4-beta-xylanase [Oxalobacteraceae bacterium A2-2]
MVTRRNVLGAIATAGLLPRAWAAAGASGGAAPSEALRDIAARKGMRFGTALGHGARQFGDPAYRALVARECNVIVAENEMKWPALEPQRGQPRYGPADEMLAWAAQQGIAMRGHNLFWQAEKWQPGWLAHEDFGAQPRQAAEQLMRAHVRGVCGHYGKQIASWDVVNEAVDPADGQLRANALTRPLGAVEQIALAFRLAAEYAPHAELVYNDYMRPDTGSAKHREGVLRLLEQLRRQGAPVHALGIQSHIGSWDEGKADLTQWRRFLDQVTGMGYGLLVTEFDVNDRRLPGDIAVRDAGVAAATRDYLDVTLSYPVLKDVLVWGMADHISWLQNWHEAPRTDGLATRPCPYDAQLNAKPMREAIAAALRAAPPRTA